MTLQFNAEDRQFVTSTGSNANPTGPTTPFDGPPAASVGLVITAKPGDPEPRLFEIGDTYDIAWAGGAISDAEVVRSDAVAEGGIIGFSGTDQSGDPAFVLWTPDFDLQSWYESVGGRASFFTSDQQQAYTHGYVCFAAEVRVATPYGLMPVGSLQPGHRVLTRDVGPRVLRWVARRRVVGQGAAAPILFEAGSIGNAAPLRLSQQHRVLISSSRAELLFGCPDVLVPARAFVGMAGVRIAPCMAVTYVHLLLDQHHLLIAEAALCESLFVGPVAADRLGEDICILPNGEESAICHDRTARPVLTYLEARILLGLSCDARRADALV